LLKGVLDVCLLALVAEQPCYGYELVGQLAARGLDLVAEGSIYPLLGRLQRDGHVEGYLVPSAAGPARKYYRITPGGKAHLARGVAEWGTFASAVGRVLGGTGDGTEVDGNGASRPEFGTGDTGVAEAGTLGQG
jgi:PadR family transcriptional regulator PadR